MSEQDASKPRKLSQRAIYALLTAQFIGEMFGTYDKSVFDVLTDEEKEEILNAWPQGKAQQKSADDD